MKKIILPLFLSVVMAISLPLSLNAFAEGETSEEDYYLISASDLATLREDIRKEVLAEFQEKLDEALNTGYKEVQANQGQVVILAQDSEIICREGTAVAITSSNTEGEGLLDISIAKELFSGQRLEHSHIYSVSERESVVAVLVIGEKASFTIRGNYEIG